MILCFPFDKSNDKFIKEAAELLIACFPQAYSDCALEEMERYRDYGGGK